MKKVLFSFFLLAVVILMGSCSGSKKVAYFQNIDYSDLAGSRGLYDAKIMPKDLLLITVSTTDPQASAPFNLSVGGSVGNSGQLSSSSSLQGYLVDNSGNIDFPIIGKLRVVGLSKNECQDLIRQRIAPYLAASERPIVTVRMSSYRVTVIGEVAKPGVIPVATEKMSIIEALAQAGDLTIHGKRDNVMLIREDATGTKSSYRLNLNDANLISSPYYYLQQNDIVYVEPNKVKTTGASIGPSTTMAFSVAGIALSLATFIISIVK